MLTAGDNILWKGSGILYQILSRGIKYLIDHDWDMWAWHAGYVIKVLEDGEIVTSQALAGGIETVTYENVEAMGECRIYHWLDNPDQAKIDDYVAEHKGKPYDTLDYIWTILGALSEKYLHWPFRITNRAYTCWENLASFDDFMGKSLQPDYEPILISKMAAALERKMSTTDELR